MRWTSWFWFIVLVVSLGIGVLDLVQNQVALLQTWHSSAISGLIVGILAGYWVFGWSYRTATVWPQPYRYTLGYTAWQLLLTVLLLTYSSSFVGPLYMLLAQISGSQPFRRWPLPMLAVATVLGLHTGMYAGIQTGDLKQILGVVLGLSVIIGTYTFIALLFQEHYKREGLMRQLRQTKEELETYALQAEELAILRERTRFAREMHDNLGHALVLVNVKLEAAERLYSVAPERGAAELHATRNLVRETMSEVRRSLNDLRSPHAPQQNLVAALRHTAHEWQQRTHLMLDCVLPDYEIAVPPPVADAVWRVAREALANIERHAVANRATLRLQNGGAELVLGIADDGVGIAPPDLKRAGHYGVVGMRERVEAVGGAFTIERVSSGGTQVEARIPLPVEDQS